MKKLLWLLALLCLPAIANAQQGWITRDNCATLPSPTTGTVCAQRTTAGGFPAGSILKYIGAAWRRVDGIKTCEVAIGNPNSTSAVLTDGDDSPVSCGNVSGVDQVIVAVACYANAGTPTVNPILTGGTSTSILSAPITCGTGTWAPGTVNGSPTLKSFSTNGATCSVTPCTLDANISTAGGTARFVVMRFTIAQ